KTQAHWRTIYSEVPGDRLLALLTYEPVWGVLDPSSPYHWAKGHLSKNALFSWTLANLVFYLLAVGLTVLGGLTGKLSAYEVSLSAALLVIPYITKSSEVGMQSFGRYAASVLPVYFVLGGILQRVPGSLAAGLVALSAVLLGLYSALFASWHGGF